MKWGERYGRADEYVGYHDMMERDTRQRRI